MKNEWRGVALQILAVKAVVLLAGTIIFLAKSNNNALFMQSWYKWDALRYLAIATEGYARTGKYVENVVFYPLFPAFIRLFSFPVFNFQLGGFIAAHFFSFAGLMTFYALARHELGTENARLSLLALLVFPTAYFFHVPYTEGLFLLCAAGSLYAARTGRWWLAGVAGAAAVLTRVTGLALFPALVVEFYMQRRETGISWKHSAWLMLLPIACGVYLLINKTITGDCFAFMKFQASSWNRQLAFPWMAFWRKFMMIITQRPSGYWFHVGIMELAAGLLLIAGAIQTFRKDRPTYGVFVLGVALLSLSTTFMLSVPRYFLGAFPIFFLHLRTGKKSPLVTAAALAMAVLYGFYFTRYLKGAWAF